MLAWKPLLALVPAGLLIGLVAGQATRPVMLVEDERPWPESMRENASETDSWPSFDLASPSSSAARGYSYRPELDYDLYVWPDQADRSAELLAADYDDGGVDTPYEPDLPLTRRAVAELAVRQAEPLAAEAVEVAATDDRAGGPDAAEESRAAFVLPPVPPPLAQAGVAPEMPDTGESETF